MRRHRRRTALLATVALLGTAAAWAAAPSGGVAGLRAVPPADCAALGRPAGTGFYEPNAPYADPRDDRADWRLATPEARGLSSARLRAAGAALAGRPGVRSLLVLRGGALVYERYLHGGRRDRSTNVHSASKSMLQALTGIAIARGDLAGPDVPLADALPGYLPAGSPKGAITVRRLLTMTSGLAWTEDRTEHRIAARPDWVRAILDQPYRAGEPFTYSTGNTHVLSAVLQRATGMSTCAFAGRYLFGPLGITPEHWPRDPRGVYAGGFNLYLTPRELAKFGQLYLDGGRWRGRRVVPAATVRQASAVTTPRAGGPYGYAAGWWATTVRGQRVALAWGWGGQYVAVLPGAGLVVSVTQDTRGDPHAVEARELDIRAFLARYVLPALRPGMDTPRG
ncbi:serine hydrolase [Pilimelia anulata]|uniref:Serine hydrolase n=1 Tax=Pilimelia anulata TaxID=53371 RepID=A0A8J3B6J0_9ACTN|nr:serine hydrolase [Pilimelia anulata]GGJ74682.1 serine hydrolase [Pilimelia anulata]